MNARYQGPAIFPPAADVRKQVEAHLDSIPGWDQIEKPSLRGARPRAKKARAKRKQRRRR